MLGWVRLTGMLFHSREWRQHAFNSELKLEEISILNIWFTSLLTSIGIWWNLQPTLNDIYAQIAHFSTVNYQNPGNSKFIYNFIKIIMFFNEFTFNSIIFLPFSPFVPHLHHKNSFHRDIFPYYMFFRIFVT